MLNAPLSRDVDVVGVRVDDEEVRRQAGGERVVAERQVVVEIAVGVEVSVVG